MIIVWLKVYVHVVIMNKCSCKCGRLKAQSSYLFCSAGLDRVLDHGLIQRCHIVCMFFVLGLGLFLRLETGSLGRCLFCFLHPYCAFLAYEHELWVEKCSNGVFMLSINAYWRSCLISFFHPKWLLQVRLQFWVEHFFLFSLQHLETFAAVPNLPILTPNLE